MYVSRRRTPALLRSRAVPSFAFTRQTANPGDLLRSDPEADFARVLRLARATSMRLTGTVLPVPGASLDALLSRARGLTDHGQLELGQPPGLAGGERR